MLSVCQLLNLPPISEGTLVAGAEGLDREVLWAAVVDIPQAGQWVRSGEILVTTFFGIRDDVDAQVNLCEELAAKQLAGMIVATGKYVDHVATPVREAADRAKFPIIELPWHVPFADVIRVVSEYSINDQYLLHKQSLAIHRSLTRLVLDGGTIQDVAHELCTLLRCPVEIDDPAFGVLAEASGPFTEIDETRRVAIRDGRSSPRLLEHLRREGVLARVRSTMVPERIDVTEQTRALGMTKPRILAPIVVARKIHGYVWIIAGERDLEPLDFHAIEHAATVAALILFRDQTAHQAHERAEQQLMGRLLSDDPHIDIALREQMGRFHLRPEASHAVIVIDPGPNEPRSVELVARNAARTQGAALIIGERAGRLAVVLECARREQLDGFCQAFIAASQSLDAPARAGASRLQEGTGSLYQAYEQALEALALLPALGQERTLAHFEELGILHWLHALPPQLLQENIYARRVQSLAEHDRTHGTQLVQTLDVFLQRDGNGVQAAQELYIHRHTLKYRLQRIADICDVDFADPLAKLNLRAALLFQRMRASFGSS